MTARITAHGTANGTARGLPCADGIGGERVVAFDGQPMTPRETRIARAAFVAGMLEDAVPTSDAARKAIDAYAARRYPLPVVTRPREVSIRTNERPRDSLVAPSLRDDPAVAGHEALYRVIDGQLEVWTLGREWFRIAGILPHLWGPDALANLADLYAHPIETVEAE